MLALWGNLAGLLLYLELAYHFIGFGWSGFHLVYAISLIMVQSGAETLLIGILRGRIKKTCYYAMLWLPVIWTGAQLVYLRIFKQPMLLAAMFRGGGDALTNYWREALSGILGALPFLILLALPAAVLPIILKKRKWILPDFAMPQIMRTIIIIAAGAAGSFFIMEIGKNTQSEYYEDYHEFYDPLTVAKTMGVLPTLQRDTTGEIANLIDALLKQSDSASNTVNAAAGKPITSQPDMAEPYTLEKQSAAQGQNTPDDQAETQGANSRTNPEAAPKLPDGTVAENPDEEESAAENPNEEEPTAGSPEMELPEEKPSVPQQFQLDYELLHSLANNQKQQWLADYIEGLVPVNSNAYTGIFEGYNLIYLTAEGFSTYAINEELTPTLYRLTHSGFVFENYYVPLWQTSTSDGEYINCTALIPDGQFSMRKSADNHMAYTLPRFFAMEGVPSLAYHNNSLDYYDRHRSHPNLGYDFKACKLGKLSRSEWGDKIFPMEHPNAWPASDLEMMQGTMPEYLGQERFHVYYMTVSGHMNYNFKGNAMSYKNREAVSGLEMSENARAYIACNMELDRALEYMLKQLEAAGQLEKTVICVSADHYPYGMSTEQYEELAGISLSDGMDLYRNSLILWNAGMEDAPVYIAKACGSMDIVPTLLNLFGFAYDSRMYAGRDILSDAEGMVIFNDRSFVTDSVICKKGAKAVWLQDKDGNDLIPDEQKDSYLEEKKQEVKNRYQFSAYILREDYYQDIEQAVIAP